MYTNYCPYILLVYKNVLYPKSPQDIIDNIKESRKEKTQYEKDNTATTASHIRKSSILKDMPSKKLYNSIQFGKIC